ncbi:DUF4307 domain-containing protein [Microbacterium immunditiarum]|uniref:DUF4307 domain-containing protein n=1 Tax=Microbacterium immunditiarum TaxID=337480 RepID=A0A7Y9GNM1_9MICO|nr:DUF4307 domain-containing protein [Microbacterium immunditiarum]NYE19828.1 hypothetical protein [Microbacterium immunditiarum]
MTTQDVLDDRYGHTPSPRRRWTISVAIVVVVAVVAVIAWIAVANAANTVEARTTAYRVVDERTVVVNFQVTAPTGRGLACAIEAQDEQHGIVGWKVVEYEASDEPGRAFSETLPTVGRATTGLVNSCWVT